MANYYLVAFKSKSVLGLGKLVKDENGAERFFRQGASDELLDCAIVAFITKHRDNRVELLDEKQFWNLDLSSFRRADQEFGIEFRGPESFIEEK